MNTLSLSGSYLRAKPFNTILNVVLLALGIAIVTVLLLVSKQVEDTLTRNSRGVDLVVGAKGSPLQIILSSVFHIDFPTGNIALKEARPLQRNRMVKNLIPLALGDSYQGFRIVGTNYDYPTLYQAELQQGDWWKETMEVTLGARVAQQLSLAPNDTFTSSHGLADDRINVHDERPFRVRGILEPTGTVVDNLILTAVESVWAVHDVHQDTTDLAKTTIGESITTQGLPKGKEDREITSLLVQYRSPMAAVQLPRYVNQRTSMQAASPPFETARLFSLVGVGVDTLQAFAYVIILIAALSTFIALYNALKERQYDLAIMRSLGASRQKLFLLVLIEGILIALSGGMLGILMGHSFLWMLSQFASQPGQLGFTAFRFLPEEGLILLASVGIGAVAAFLPALTAYRTDIGQVLAQK